MNPRAALGSGATFSAIWVSPQLTSSAMIAGSCTAAANP